MRKAMLFYFVIVFFAACNNTDTTMDDSKTDSSTAVTTNLPYTLDETPDWERGDQNHVALAMNALKSFETADIDNSRQYFADSMEFRGDYWHFKGTTDSLMAELKKYRANYANYTIRMEDYESVKSKTNGDEYVSMWYHESYTDSKGKTDSLYVMDDVKIKNGKIIAIDSKVRHYPNQPNK